MKAMFRRTLRQFLDAKPRLRGFSNALRGHQIVTLEYAVNMVPRWGPEGHPRLFDRIAAGKERYRERLGSFVSSREQLLALKDVDWVNGFLPAIDSITLYCLLAHCNPKRYIEVGSGNSTMFARASIRDNGLRTRITSIDPAPRRAIEAAADEIIRKPAEQAGAHVFEALEAGDILFVDNSHRCLPNSDVTVFFLDVLPKIKPGVLVQVHDVCLPWDYPVGMTQKAYSEQYLLAALLLMGADIDIILPNKYIERSPDLVAVLSPILDGLADVEREGCSFWFTRSEPSESRTMRR